MSPAFREVWRAGGLAEGEEFVQPAALAVNDVGRVAVADFGLAEVLLIGPDGRWEGPVATRGEGPGEVQVPVAVTWRDSDRLLVLDLGLARVTEFDVASGAKETMSLNRAFVTPVVRQGQVRLAAIQPDGTAWLELPGEELSSGWETRTYARSRAGQEGIDSIAVSAVRVVGEGKYRFMSVPGWPRALLGVGRRGWVISDSSARYEMKYVGDDGRVVAHVCYPVASRATKGTALGDSGRIDSREPPQDLLALLQGLEVAPASAPFSRLLVDADGRLWVQRDPPRPWDGLDTTYGVAGSKYDVFSARGEYLGSLRIPPGHRLQAAQGARIWTFTIGDLDEFHVVAFEMTDGA